MGSISRASVTTVEQLPVVIIFKGYFESYCILSIAEGDFQAYLLNNAINLYTPVVSLPYLSVYFCVGPQN